MKSTENDFDTQRSECCAWLGLLKPLLSDAMVAAIAVDSAAAKDVEISCWGVVALRLKVLSVGLRGLLCTRPKGVPALGVYPP
jgi:hypothetical protein